MRTVDSAACVKSTPHHARETGRATDGTRIHRTRGTGTRHAHTHRTQHARTWHMRSDATIPYPPTPSPEKRIAHPHLAFPQSWFWTASMKCKAASSTIDIDLTAHISTLDSFGSSAEQSEASEAEAPCMGHASSAQRASRAGIWAGPANELASRARGTAAHRAHAHLQACGQRPERLGAGAALRLERLCGGALGWACCRRRTSSTRQRSARSRRVAAARGGRGACCIALTCLLLPRRSVCGSRAVARLGSARHRLVALRPPRRRELCGLRRPAQPLRQLALQTLQALRAAPAPAHGRTA